MDFAEQIRTEGRGGASRQAGSGAKRRKLLALRRGGREGSGGFKDGDGEANDRKEGEVRQPAGNERVTDDRVGDETRPQPAIRLIQPSG